MKVVHVINSDIRGGAPKAAFALHKALINVGVDSKMLVQRKFSTDKSVYSFNKSFVDKQKTNIRMLLDLLQMKALTKTNKGRFSFASIGLDISQHRIIQEADLVHLHWINEGYLSLKSLSKLAEINKPIVWTLHDMWAFTGGCHYSEGCIKYETECSYCPYLETSSGNDFSKKLRDKKAEIYKHVNPTIVTCSQWLGECAHSSPLLNKFPITIIPNTIDIDVYKPLDKKTIRKELNLPEDKTLILFGTLNVKEERKGFTQLINSLSIMLQKDPSLKNRVELLMFGTALQEEVNKLPLKVNSFGRINKEEFLVKCYNAADVFIAPSLEDNLPNTVMESLSCGIPVAAFNIGGMPDMIEHKKNGYLAKPFSVEDLANGISWIINEGTIEVNLHEQSRNKIINNFTDKIIGEKYKQLYETLTLPVKNSP